MTRHCRTNQNYPVYTPPSKVQQVTGCLSRSTALRREKDDPAFPKRVRVSSGLTAWVTEELLGYLERRERVK